MRSDRRCHDQSTAWTRLEVVSVCFAILAPVLCREASIITHAEGEPSWLGCDLPYLRTRHA